MEEKKKVGRCGGNSGKQKGQVPFHRTHSHGHNKQQPYAPKLFPQKKKKNGGRGKVVVQGGEEGPMKNGISVMQQRKQWFGTQGTSTSQKRDRRVRREGKRGNIQGWPNGGFL